MVKVVKRLRQMDPLRCRVELLLAGAYYPGGFCVKITTNSEEVLAAAQDAWGHGRQEFSCVPVCLRVLVQPEGGVADQPVHRMQGRMYSIVSDAQNFAHLDLDSQLAFIHVSAATAMEHSRLRWSFLEASAYVMLCQRHIVPVHAACVARAGHGILLCGPSGAGKSTLSYACARAGWTFLTDDATWLLPHTADCVAIGRPREARFRMDAPQLFPELERYAIRARPNGKIGIQVPLADLPHIQTAGRAPIAAIVFLERTAGIPGARSIAGAEAVEELIADMPSYGDATDAIHDRTVRRLAAVPAWRMRYETVQDGIRILESLAI